jgi:hypothetical protein
VRRASPRTLAIAVGCVTAACAASVAGGAPAAVDLEVNVGAAVTNSRPVLVANGSTVTVTSRTFYVFVDVSLIAPAAAKGTVRAELGPSLSWGRDGPDPGEQCVGTATAGVCEIGDLQPIAGQSSSGWFWDVVAPQNGAYTFGAALTSTSDTDTDLSNNASAITIVVSEAQGGGGGGGGGSAAAARASSVKLSPAAPKAGSRVVASVRVTKGGSPIRPTGVTCKGTIGGTKVKGGPRAASGVASCLFKTARSAKGKSLAGSISFRAGGSAFTKRFAVRLG